MPLGHFLLTYVCKVCTNFDKLCTICASTVCRLSLVATNAAFASNFNAESIIYTWNFPAKTKMESLYLFSKVIYNSIKSA